MTGDQVAIYGKSFWHNNGSGLSNSYITVVNDLLTTLAGSSAVATAGKGATAGALTGSSVIPSDVSSLLGSEPTASGRPNAYVNWILFDEQFRVVSSNSGFDPVNSSADVLKTHSQSVSISKSGYLYVYVSNESNQDVFFDNLQVIHTRGPLVEETHYYPFGLTMAGISSKAAGKLENRYKYNGNKLESGEWSDGSGLEIYDFNARTYDQQLGRFMQIDPLVEDGQESWTPYQFGFNNPILHNDPDGRQPVVPIIRALYYLAKLAQENGGKVASSMTPTVLRDGTAVVRTAMPIEVLKELRQASSENKAEVAKGSNNEKTSEAAKTGQEAHRQEQAKLRKEGAETEVPMTLKDGTQVRKDAVREDGTTVIIKPDTKSGHKSADKREKLMQDNGHKTEKIFYDPKDPKYQPGSPTYIGPKKTN